MGVGAGRRTFRSREIRPGLRAAESARSSSDDPCELLIETGLRRTRSRDRRPRTHRWDSCAEELFARGDLLDRMSVAFLVTPSRVRYCVADVARRLTPCPRASRPSVGPPPLRVPFFLRNSLKEYR
jgi:hypothetical protein